MSRSNQPKRPSEYRAPVFMSTVPEGARKEAEEMAARHGVDEPRQATKAKAKPKPKPEPAPAAEAATEPVPETATESED